MAIRPPKTYHLSFWQYWWKRYGWNSSEPRQSFVYGERRPRILYWLGSALWSGQWLKPGKLSNGPGDGYLSHYRQGPKLTSQNLGSVSSRAEKQIAYDSQNNALYSHDRVNHSYQRIKILNKEVKAKIDKNNSGSFIRYSLWKSLQKDNSTP